MSKNIKVILLPLLIFVGLVTINMYEPFPVKAVSKSDVLKKVSKANGDMVKITSNEQGYQWYISDIKHADENLVELMKDRGWSFVKKDTNKYYTFKGVQGDIVVIGEVWKEEYKIFHFPKDI